MKLGTSQYDAELQMFTDKPREANLDQLRFMRWLAEHGRLEHRMEGDSVGPFALEALIMEAPTAA